VSIDSHNCVVLAIYRPGSEAVTALFFDELANVLNRIATVCEQIFVVSDINIRLDRPEDPNACRLFDIFDCNGFALHVAAELTTHDSGGTIDVVASRPDYDAAAVACVRVVFVLNSGLSVGLLRWCVAAGTPPCPPLRKKTPCVALTLGG
jgi:hypothetical protein